MSLQTVKDPAQAKGRPIISGDRGGLSYRTSDSPNGDGNVLPPPNNGLLAEIGDGVNYLGIFLDQGRYLLKYPAELGEVAEFMTSEYDAGNTITNIVLAACRKYNLHFVS